MKDYVITPFIISQLLQFFEISKISTVDFLVDVLKGFNHKVFKLIWYSLLICLPLTSKDYLQLKKMKCSLFVQSSTTLIPIFIL